MKKYLIALAALAVLGCNQTPAPTTPDESKSTTDQSALATPPATDSTPSAPVAAPTTPPATEPTPAAPATPEKKVVYEKSCPVAKGYELNSAECNAYQKAYHNASIANRLLGETKYNTGSATKA